MILSSVQQKLATFCGFFGRLRAGGYRMAPAFLVLGTAISGGCSSSGYYSVQGKVVDQSGQPIAGLEGSQIVFTLVDGPTSSVGEIGSDGSFTIFTDRPGDGA